MEYGRTAASCTAGGQSACVQRKNSDCIPTYQKVMAYASDISLLYEMEIPLQVLSQLIKDP